MGEGKILVVGGGISGVTAAVEAAEMEYDVILIEKEPTLGGRVSQLRYYFPKLCPPACGLEINYRRIKENPRIKFYTMAQIKKIEGEPGDYKVTVEIAPRYVNENCTCCGECEKVCQGERVDTFNFGLGKTKAIYLPHEHAFPMRYVLDKSALAEGDLERIMEVCKAKAIDPDMQPQTLEFNVGAIIWATGWKPYDATKLTNLKYGQPGFENVITNMQMERLAAPNGPTKGKILRPSDQTVPQTIAFVQCAGSRDENHLPYCSYICCLASLKHSLYFAEQNPEGKAYIFYIDIRTPGRYEKFLNRAKEEANIEFIKGKVADIQQAENGDLIVIAEDTLSGKRVQQKVNMVVLATGMQPSLAGEEIPTILEVDENGFIIPSEAKGMYACGCARMPLDVMSSNETATAAALKAIQTLVRG